MVPLRYATALTHLRNAVEKGYGVLDSVSVIDDAQAVSVRWSDGVVARFHVFWLIDNSFDADTRHPANGQRLITIDQVPLQATAAEARINGDALELTLKSNAKKLTFAGEWLRAHRYDGIETPAAPWMAPGVETWGAELQPTLRVHDYGAVVADDRARADWLADVRRYGVARLAGVSTEPGSVVGVVDRFGYVRKTNYGETFMVRAEVSPSNLAYTNAGLQAHTDNPYRDPVPTVQLLHCLQNDVEGGESLVVDGFRAAQVLLDEAPEDFAQLTGHVARYEYAGQAGVRLTARRPMIELSPDGQLTGVRFNSRSVAPLVDIPYDDMPRYYAAYRRFSDIIDRPDMAVTFKLKPGELFIVDNTRVMHARTAFSGTGQRVLEGCYADKDGLLSTLSAIETHSGEFAA